MATNKLSVPLGSGVLLLSDPVQSHFMAKTAGYVSHKTYSVPGRLTLERFRPGSVICMRAEFELTVIRTARICGHIICTLEVTHLFDLVFEPMLDILLYRAYGYDTTGTQLRACAYDVRV